MLLELMQIILKWHLCVSLSKSQLLLDPLLDLICFVNTETLSYHNLFFKIFC